jgi:hypothetical protein
MNTTAFATDIEGISKCGNGQVLAQIHKLRYQVTLQCTRVIMQTMSSLGCRPQPESKRLAMCEGTCQAGLTSFTNIVFNRTACPNGPGPLSTHRTYESVCRESKANESKVL